jgi:uncharacterized membrane protein YkoI
MSLRTLLAAVAAVALSAGAAAAQNPAPSSTPQKAAPQKMAHHTAMAPSITADSAKAIAVKEVPGATVASEKLKTRNGRQYYLFGLHAGKSKALIRATVDASTGAFSRLDQPHPAKS